VDELEAREHDGDDHCFAGECHAPGEEGRDEAAQQRADSGGNRGSGTHKRIRLPLHRPCEVAVDEGLHRREQERCAEAADDRPEDHDREQVLRQRHRHRAGGVAQQAEHVRAFAPEQVADLARDQDERRRHERLQRDRRLDAARGRVEVVDDRRDRHVHQRGVDDEHEHRHREQDGEAHVARRFCRDGGGRLLGHRRSTLARPVRSRFIRCG
jgi:hypothetical protein